MKQSDFRPYLVQRIEKMEQDTPPVGNLIGYYKDPKAHPLSDMERDILRNILPLDYMGSSEFEWGAIPAALKTMASQSALMERTIKLKGKPDHFMLDEVDEKQLVEKEIEVYILAPAAIIEFIPSYLEQNLTDRRAMRHKELPHYSKMFGEIHQVYAIRGQPRPKNRTEFRKASLTMFLDVDNHWVISSDKKQFEYLKIMLGF